MSIDKNKKEAIRWLLTSNDDLDSAMILKENRKYAHACFHAQQAAEKALKAVWYYADSDPWGHSIYRLIDDLKTVDIKLFETFKIFSREGAILDRFYIPTRYPNGLPDITPDAAFSREDAETCISNAEKITAAVRNHLKQDHQL